MNPFEIGKEYNFNSIEDYAQAKGYELVENGYLTIGKSFVYIEKNDKTTSFVATGFIPAIGMIYQCVYKDK